MKVPIRSSSLYLQFFIIISFLSCIDNGPGCGDPRADNYCGSCTENLKEECKYTCKISFWHGKSTSDTLLKYGSNKLKYYMRDELGTDVIFGESYAATYWPSEPHCAQEHTTTFIKILDQRDADKNIISIQSKFTIRDENNRLIWSKDITLEPGCSRIPLTFQ